ncbi:MAG: hypothetical protein ACRDRK_26320, partial [Pseudonocardia sp.]
PQWAREALGPVPDATTDPDGRAEWEARAGWAGSYRELVDHTDDADPLGAAPPAGLVEKHAVFRAAHTALDLPDAGADEEAMSEGQLRARVIAARREEAWAPRYVADELDATHEALRTARADATVWAARAGTEPDPDQAAQLRAAAQEAGERAGQLAQLVADLTAADDARSLWLIETTLTREKGERARVALSWRGIDIDSPEDRVTAQDWLDADHAAKLAADPDRPITEHDLTAPDLRDTDLHDTTLPDTDRHDQQRDDQQRDDRQLGSRYRDARPGDHADRTTDPDETLPDIRPAPALGAADDDRAATERDATERDADDRAVANRDADERDGEGHAIDRDTDPAVDQDREADQIDDGDLDNRINRPELPELVVPDIRETSTPDMGERADPAQRRRVPLRDETSVTVDRARLAVAEVDARRAAEAAALTDTEQDHADDTDMADSADARVDPDAQRREELIRWSAQDDQGPGRDRHAGEADGDALQR